MREKVWRYMRENRMVEPKGRVIVALSGGADSVCLFWLLKELAQKGEIELRAIHVNHGLRGSDADRDAEFSRALCAQARIPCQVVRADVAAIAKEKKLSLEEAGRVVRYQAFEEAARAWDLEQAAKDWKDKRKEREESEEIEERKERPQYRPCKIAVAHHKDDDAETVLHHLFRGSGLRGLSGIAPVRERIIRPLLCVERHEILSFLEKEGLSWCEDATNAENIYMRNRIRNELLPWVKEHVNKEAVKHITEAKQWIADADNFLEYSTWQCYRDVVREYGEGLLIQKDALKRQHQALHPYVVRMALENLGAGGKDWSIVHVRAILELMDKQVGKVRDLPEQIVAKRVYDGVQIEKRKPEETKTLGTYQFSCFSYEKGMEIPQNQYTKWFDYDKIKDTVSVRHRKVGDFITISGGGRKTVKEYMIHEKIPRELRDTIDLVADGSHILWIVGYRISEMYKVTEDTRTILQVQFDGGTEDGR